MARFEYSCNGCAFEVNRELKKNSFVISITSDETAHEFVGEFYKKNENEIYFQIGNKPQLGYVVNDGSRIWVSINGQSFQIDEVCDDDIGSGGPGMAGGGDGKISPPMPGSVVRMLVAEGQQVEKGQAVVVVESMKMENAIDAPFDAVVVAVNAAAGDAVQPSDVIVELKPLDE